MNSTYTSLLFALLVLGCMPTVAAQPEADEGVTASGNQTTMATSVAAPFGAYPAQFIGVTQDFAGTVVVDAPYSANALTESVQMLHDGNRIRQRNEARLYRDSAGRTRREQQLNALGAWQLASPAAQLVFIHDPVGQEGFLLDVKNRSARRLGAPGGSLSSVAQNGATVTFTARPALPATGGAAVNEGTAAFSLTSADFGASSEDLGERSFDGVTATGTRTRMTIAAGTLGNELPIEVVIERWYSPALQMVVFRRHSDPRFGETTYRLTNLSTEEPDAALFRVPNDFTIVE